jgi:hypothetical protein
MALPAVFGGSSVPIVPLVHRSQNASRRMKYIEGGVQDARDVITDGEQQHERDDRENEEELQEKHAELRI